MSSIKIETVFNIDLEFNTAPVHKRLMAYVIDVAILFCYLKLVKMLMYDVLNLNPYTNIGLDMIVISLPMLLYHLLCEVYLNGQSFGKRILKIRVISLSGGEPTLSQYIIRWATRFFEWPFLFGYIGAGNLDIIIYIIITTFFGIGVIIIIAVTQNDQRLGDLAAGTVVVNTRSSMNVRDTIFMNVDHSTHNVLYPQVMRLSDTDINTIQNVVKQSYKYGEGISDRVANRVCEALQIETKLSSRDFLEKLLEDYNYLATRD